MNLYQTPNAELRDGSVDLPLTKASLVARFVAAIIDLTLVFAVDAILFYAFGRFFSDSLIRVILGNLSNLTTAFIFSIVAIFMLGGIAVYVLLNVRTLYLSGQSLGMSLLKIHIVDHQGKLLPWKHIVIKRFIPFWVILFVPYVGGMLFIINVLPIFLKQRQCLHDKFAGSDVVKTTQLRS